MFFAEIRLKSKLHFFIQTGRPFLQPFNLLTF